MTVYDSSLRIDDLDDSPEAVSYVGRNVAGPAVTPPLVMFELYQGAVSRSAPADFEGLDRALGWIDVLETGSEYARAAGRLQQALRQRGTRLAARDAFIAGCALVLGQRLAVTESDFDVPGFPDLLAVDLV